MTLGNQVEAVVGTVSDYTDLNQYLSDGASFVIGSADDNLLMRYSTAEYVSSDAGLSVQGKRVLKVSRGGYQAREVSEEHVQRLTDGASLYVARARSPRYYIQAGRLFMKPNPTASAQMRVESVSTNPAAVYTAESITGVPSELLRLVILYAARAVVQKRIEDRTTDDDVELQAAEIRLRQEIDKEFEQELNLRLPRAQ